MTVDRQQVNRFLSESGLPAALCSTLDKLAAKDPSLALEQAQLAVSGGLRASAPRRHRADVDTIIASACAEGRIGPARAGYWRERYAADPRGVETLLTASVEDGGLYAVGRVPQAPVITAAQEARDHERSFAAAFPKQASALGYEPRAASPFTVEPQPSPVRRPGRTPVTHIRDSS